MSPWTALLQSLHSALIDEITDRHPEPKPELGLPKKFKSFQFPFAKAEKLFWAKTSFPGSVGASFIAFEDDFLKTLQLTGPLPNLREVKSGQRSKFKTSFLTPPRFQQSSRVYPISFGFLSFCPLENAGWGLEFKSKLNASMRLNLMQ
jgi:hypothetical protein